MTTQITNDAQQKWVKVVSALMEHGFQSQGALNKMGISSEDLLESLESGYVRRYWTVAGSPVYRSTVKGRKTLSMLRSKQQLAYSKATVSTPREPVKYTPYVPQKWFNPRPESLQALNVPSRGLI